jgi:hypothetical protein
MSPSSLKSMAATTNAQVGIEFELYVDGNALDIPSNTVEVNLDNVEVHNISSFCGLWDNDDDVSRDDINAMETELTNAFKKWLDYDIIRLANTKFDPDDDSEDDDTTAEKERLEQLISITGDHLMSDNIDKFVAPVIEKYSRGLDAHSLKALEYFLTNAPVKQIVNSAKTAYVLANVNITKSPSNSGRYPPPSGKFKFPRAVKSDKYSTHYSGLEYEGSSVYMDLLNGDDLTDSEIFFKRPWRTDGPTSLKFKNGEWQPDYSVSWSLDGENLCSQEEYEAKKGPYTGQMLPDNILEFIEIHKNLISTGIMDSAYDDMDQILNQSAREELAVISTGDDLFSRATNGLAEKVKKDYHEFAIYGMGDDDMEALFLEEVLPRVKRNTDGMLDVSWFNEFNSIVELKAYNRGFDRSTLTGEEDEDDLSQISGYYIELGQISVPPHPTEPEDNEDGYDIDDEKKLAAIASALEQYVGKKVRHGGYHSHSGSGNYRVEADSSLGDKNGHEDAAAEIIMPYMHISKAYEQIEHILRFCKDMRCYTNDSTGLHINLSVPDQDEVDYLKLILFMGDQYVLQTFDREFNQYCKSSFNKIIHTLNGGQKFDSVSTHVGKILDGIKNNTVNLAQRAIQEKYSSVHLQSGWVEFRGPGNDWLHGGLDLILNTVNRFAVAMDIAADPNKYKNEYMKKLYKLISSHYPQIDNIAQISAIYLSSNGDDGRKRQALKSLLQQKARWRTNANNPLLTKNDIDRTTKVNAASIARSLNFDKTEISNYFTNLFHQAGMALPLGIRYKVTLPSEQIVINEPAYSTAHVLAKFLTSLNQKYGIDQTDFEDIIDSIKIEQINPPV